jgi:hypothetical protein
MSEECCVEKMEVVSWRCRVLVWWKPTGWIRLSRWSGGVASSWEVGRRGGSVGVFYRRRVVVRRWQWWRCW